ncbi:hypothetical protein [uncultured Tateyamaria sp.]|uniref:hypothetical protein n=1 Tax=Tateyamaria sp. 1078 TaxID=3417464 RepID=UPI00260A3A58|nr:hypothetical protein [uncultured Tateyamaria sp.]
MRWLAALFALISAPVLAQAVIPRAEGDAALAAALAQPGLIVDGVAVWPVDWDRATPTDLLVQVVYASATGGNATDLEYRIVTPSPDGPILGAPFDLPGDGIKEVQTHPQGALLTQYVYRAGDPRCCHSGLISTILSRGIP